MDTCDTNIPRSSLSTFTAFAPLVTTVVVIIYSTPIFTVVMVPLVIIFGLLQVYTLYTVLSIHQTTNSNNIALSNSTDKYFHFAMH